MPPGPPPGSWPPPGEDSWASSGEWPTHPPAHPPLYPPVDHPPTWPPSSLAPGPPPWVTDAEVPAGHDDEPRPWVWALVASAGALSLLIAFLIGTVYVDELEAADNGTAETAAPPSAAPAPPSTPPPTVDDPTTDDVPDLGDLFGGADPFGGGDPFGLDPEDDPFGLDPEEDPFGLPPEEDPFGGLLGPGEGFGLGGADLDCLLSELDDDPTLGDYLDDPLAAPEALDGEAFLRLFEMFETCGLLPAVADEMVTQTPGLTEAQALCVLESMMGLPPEALDSILAAGDDVTALDPEAMALLFGAVIDCGLSGTA